MRYYVLGLLLGLFAVPSLTVRASAEVPPLLQNVHRIVCLGDSITQGGEGPGGYVWLVRYYLKALYPHQDIEVINAGISGNRSNDMLARFQRDVLDKKPDLVTISVGVNDVWHGFDNTHPKGDGPNAIPLDAYRKNVDTMITQAQQAGAKVVILSTTVIYEDLDILHNARTIPYNEALRELAQTHNATFVDLQKPFRDIITLYRRETGAHDLLLTVDGVHMNSSGNKVMAHTLLSGLGVTSKARASIQKQIDQVLREAAKTHE